MISEPQKIKKALSYQNETEDLVILLINYVLTAFNGINERNQSFIDGGMYSMSLYALHYLGACPLNLRKKKRSTFKEKI